MMWQPDQVTSGIVARIARAPLVRKSCAKGQVSSLTSVRSFEATRKRVGISNQHITHTYSTLPLDHRRATAAAAALVAVAAAAELARGDRCATAQAGALVADARPNNATTQHATTAPSMAAVLAGQSSSLSSPPLAALTACGARSCFPKRSSFLSGACLGKWSVGRCRRTMAQTKWSSLTSSLLASFNSWPSTKPEVHTHTDRTHKHTHRQYMCVSQLSVRWRATRTSSPGQQV
jgi:hypothetical protein